MQSLQAVHIAALTSTGVSEAAYLGMGNPAEGSKRGSNQGSTAWKRP